MKFSKFTNEVITNGLPDWMDEDRNPFITDSGQTYVKYDSLKMENFFDLLSGIKLTYGYKGQDICYQHIEGQQIFKSNDEYTLSFLDGKIKVTIE